MPSRPRVRKETRPSDVRRSFVCFSFFFFFFFSLLHFTSFCNLLSALLRLASVPAWRQSCCPALFYFFRRPLSQPVRPSELGRTSSHALTRQATAATDRDRRDSGAVPAERIGPSSPPSVPLLRSHAGGAPAAAGPAACVDGLVDRVPGLPGRLVRLDRLPVPCLPMLPTSVAAHAACPASTACVVPAAAPRDDGPAPRARPGADPRAAAARRLEPVHRQE